MNTIQYILTSTACLSIFYIAYRLIFRKEANFKQLRAYLLLSVFTSLLLPLNSYRLNLIFFESQDVVTTSSLETTSSGSPNIAAPIQVKINNESVVLKTEISKAQTPINWLNIMLVIYVSVTVVLLVRILVQVTFLFIKYYTSERIRKTDYVIIRNNWSKNTFSFFNWIFLQSDFSSREEEEQVISHEKIHAAQYHTFDLIVIELLAAVMWFNPLIWMMRNSIQLVHEYLADEGALSTGIDKLKYQALLINQVSEEKLICLSSDFNHSLIKKRMIMMTKSKFNQQTKLKILALIPVAIVLFLGIACVNGQNKPNTVTAIQPVKMNVLYIGVDNPIRIAASGYDASELTVSVDNGKISGKDGEYVILPTEPGKANVIVTDNKGKELQRTEFRVKLAPDPVAALKTSDGLKRNGLITKRELLEAKGIDAFMQNFDFDVRFRVVSFVLSFTTPGKFVIVEEVSKTDKFTERQIEFIKGLVKWQKVTIEEITAIDPYGKLRKLNPMVFTISGE